MLETVRVEQWLYQVLSSDAVLAGHVGGRIYSYVAPGDAAFPFIVYSHQASRDVLGVGPARIMANLLYQVKVIGVGSSVVPLKVIADRIDELLHGASGAVADGTVLACVREQPLSYVEVDEGVRYYHIGGLYRIYAQ